MFLLVDRLEVRVNRNIKAVVIPLNVAGHDGFDLWLVKDRFDFGFFIDVGVVVNRWAVVVNMLKLIFICLFNSDYLFRVFIPQTNPWIILELVLEHYVLFEEFLFLVMQERVLTLQFGDNSLQFSDNSFIFLVYLGSCWFELMHLAVNIDIVDGCLSYVLGMDSLLQETRSPLVYLSFLVFHSVKCKIYC